MRRYFAVNISSLRTTCSVVKVTVSWRRPRSNYGPLTLTLPILSVDETEPAAVCPIERNAGDRVWYSTARDVCGCLPPSVIILPHHLTPAGPISPSGDYRLPPEGSVRTFVCQRNPCRAQSFLPQSLFFYPLIRREGKGGG